MFVMVLAFQVIKKYEEDRERRRQERERRQQEQERLRQEQFDRGIALALEADRRRQGTGDSLEQAIEKLRAEDWQPPQS